MENKNKLYVVDDPKLKAEWHTDKNKDINPNDITLGSGRKVWWKCEYQDPRSGEKFLFEWLASVEKRAKGEGCPFISGKRVWCGYNDLKTVNPELASQWHPTKNGDLKPTDVTWSSGKKVWWKCEKDHEWLATIDHRARGRNCPYCLNKKVWVGYNDLYTKNPKLASQWHPTKNGDLKPTDVTVQSNKSVWWLFQYDDSKTGRHFDFEWKQRVSERYRHPKCPFLTNSKIWPGYNDLETVNPELAAEWHPNKNDDLKPSEISPNSKKVVWWYKKYYDNTRKKEFFFEWKAKICNRNAGDGCPYLNGHKTWPGFNDLESTNPKLASELHPTKNRGLEASNLTVMSNKKVWWLCPKCGREWKATVAHRSEGQNCICEKKE